jgi:hypothetical protein
MKESCIQDTT